MKRSKDESHDSSSGGERVKEGRRSSGGGGGEEGEKMETNSASAQEGTLVDLYRRGELPRPYICDLVLFA